MTPGATEPVRLKRTVNLFNGFSIIVGIIVGSGIFVSPQGVLINSGSVGVSLIIWFLCGLFALFGSLCFAELGTSISASGGDYHYIGLAYGPTLSFLYLWVTFGAILPCSNAIAALTFARYMLEPFCQPPEESVRLLALALLGLVTYVNCVSVNGAMRLQNTFTIGKVIALGLVIVYGLYYIISGNALDQVNIVKKGTLWQGSETSPFYLAQAFYAGFYTYAGWNSLNFVTEELKDPIKNMPRAIILSISFITFLYIFTNLAYFAVLTKEEILASDAIAVSFGKRVLGEGFWIIMPLAVSLSTMGSLNGGVFSGSRIVMAGARQGQLFWVLKTIHAKNCSPTASIIILGLLSSFYLITTKILSLIQYLILVEASFAALAVSTVLVLRHKMPYLERPLRIPTIIPITYLVFSFFMLSLPIWISPLESSLGIAFMLSGIPVYYATARWKRKPQAYQRVLDCFNLTIQKLTFGLEPDTATTMTITTDDPNVN